MKGLFIRFVVTGVAVLLATEIVPGIRVESVAAGLAAVIVFAFLNAVLRPVLYLLSLPLIIVTLGLFMVVINALLLQLAAWLVKGFVVEGLWPSVWGALLISVVSTALNVLVSDTGHMEVVVHRNRRPPKIINPE
jgi:putative membrane protein